MKFLKLKEIIYDRINDSMKHISFSKAIMNPDRVVILEGTENIIAKDKKNNFSIDKIKRKIPMNFIRINNILHRELNDIEYIKFWNNIKIYEIID